MLVTLRGDVLGEVVACPGAAESLNDRMTLLGPPSAGELRLIVEEPLRAPGMPPNAPGLAERIAADAPSESLALLQFALTMLWERQRGGVIEHAAYDGERLLIDLRAARVSAAPVVDARLASRNPW